MGETAVNAARAVNYQGAGTVEFLLDQQKFYFMEMNTRLQVEHPITEMITGLDLVECQLRVAAGEKLPIVEQNQITFTGHAFEARILAEDPSKDFLPSTGKLVYLKFPTQSAQLRIDSGVKQEDHIEIYYDSLIAKLIVANHTREAALNDLRLALAKTYVVGVQTNINLLTAIINNQQYQLGQYNTHFLQTHPQLSATPPLIADEKILATTALGLLLAQKNQLHKQAHLSTDSHSTWYFNDHWRLNNDDPQLLIFYDDSKEIIIPVTCLHQGYELIINKKYFRVNGELDDNGELFGEVDGQPIQATLFLDKQKLHLFAQYHYVFALTKASTPAFAGAQDSNRLIAPMPGTLVSIHVEEGQCVNKGDRLLVIEAMKMEHTLFAPNRGTIKHLFYHKGDLVKEGELLLDFE